MRNLDGRDLPISTTSDLAAERYRHGVALLLSAWPGAAERLDEAIAADPDFALAARIAAPDERSAIIGSFAVGGIR